MRKYSSAIRTMSFNHMVQKCRCENRLKGTTVRFIRMIVDVIHIVVDYFIFTPRLYSMNLRYLLYLLQWKSHKWESDKWENRLSGKNVDSTFPFTT